MAQWVPALAPHVWLDAPLDAREWNHMHVESHPKLDGVVHTATVQRGMDLARHLRVVFTDGAPVDAAAVSWEIGGTPIAAGTHMPLDVLPLAFLRYHNVCVTAPAPFTLLYDIVDTTVDERERAGAHALAPTVLFFPLLDNSETHLGFRGGFAYRAPAH